MKEEKKPKFLVSLISLLFYPPLCASEGLVLSNLWAWHVSPLLGWDPLPWHTCAGLVCLWTILRYTPTRVLTTAEDEAETPEDYISRNLLPFLMQVEVLLQVWLVGWIFHFGWWGQP